MNKGDAIPESDDYWMGAFMVSGVIYVAEWVPD